MMQVTRTKLPSFAQVPEQPSPEAVLLSSHSSPAPTVPSPHTPKHGYQWDGKRLARLGCTFTVVPNLQSCMWVSIRLHWHGSHHHTPPQSPLCHHHKSLRMGSGVWPSADVNMPLIQVLIPTFFLACGRAAVTISTVAIVALFPSSDGTIATDP